MEREIALAKLRLLIGQDLRQLAERHGVTVFREGKRNKGWAGHVLERALGLSPGSAQAPNFGSWELKLVSLYRLKTTGLVTAKETMQITMLDPVHVAATPFEHSHVLSKMRSMVVCARLWVDEHETSSPLVDVVQFTLDDAELYEQIRSDYEEVRSALRRGGLEAVHSHMGVLIQARTKGPGHGSTSRGFYARKAFVNRVLRLPREWEGLGQWQREGPSRR